jgi:ATP-dependent helicase HrpB
MKQRRSDGDDRPCPEPLPVDEAIPAIRGALASGSSLVLQAPPGAGKTTHVPLALLDEAWLASSKIVMLEPRRLATRAVSRRMAELLGESVGDTVGYRVRRDSRVGPATRIEVVTEGILTRMMQRDPTLDGVGLVIFDEFHERSVNADMGIALTLQTQSLVRPDLRILVMSATLDGERVAALLGGAPVITSLGRTHPVELSYSARPDRRALAETVAARVLATSSSGSGDVLVFLPGGGEIRRVAAMLEGRLPDRVRVEMLYGDLSQASQDAAIAPAAAGWRKVVLSTPIAETSLTIPGVSVVIDSGLARAPRFSPASGMTRLETVRISRSSADQRAGRAGRTGPGRCYRMWPEQEQHHLAEHSTPEILQTDLAPVVLDLAVAGIRESDELRWLDAPPAAAWAQATETLRMLGALDSTRSATAHGRAMGALPAHPRIAHMLLASQAMGGGTIACDIAAILTERDFVRSGSGPADADIEIRLEVLGALAEGRRIERESIDVALARRVAHESLALKRQLGVSRKPSGDMVSAGVVLGLAYPDRIAQARGAMDGRFLLRNGRGAALTHPQALSAAEYIVAAELDGDSRSSRVFLAAALTREELDAHFADQFTTETTVDWDETRRSVRAVQRTMLGSIAISESSIPAPQTDAVSKVLLDVVRREGIDALPWSDAARDLRTRIAFVRKRHAGWPDVSNDALAAGLHEWLAPILAGRTSLRDIAGELETALLATLDWQQRTELERLAPHHYTAPTGSRAAIDYSDPDAPRVSVRLQEMFGVRETPTIDAGRVALTLELLSPARRPVQVTRDLAGFWQGSYFDVRRELRGRYPKHAWPEDPLSATPTSRVKRRDG